MACRGEGEATIGKSIPGGFVRKDLVYSVNRVRSAIILYPLFSRI